VKKQLTLIGLIIVVLISALAPTIASAVDQLSARNTPMNRENRRQIEEQILKSTVRVLVQSLTVKADESGYELDDTLGHATVMGDRYLVTHNHFDIPLSIRPQEGDPGAYGQVLLYNAAGDLVFKGPLSDFELVREDKETLVFAYKEGGLFEKLGFTSAEFVDWTMLSLRPGMELAQVDWDGQTTRVDWATIQEVDVEDGVPRLVLNDGAIPGASGGGVFWDGAHVANNWRLEEQVGPGGEVVGELTTVALNSTAVLNF
jgi:hypothetical protein